MIRQESALLEMVRKVNINDDFFREAMERREELPFDSDRKLMSTKYLLHGIPTVLTKGALDVLLDRTVCIWDENGVRELAKDDRTRIEEMNRQFSQNGLRVCVCISGIAGDTYIGGGERFYLPGSCGNR